MVNYGSGGMGAEVVANRLGVGPMHDCLSCAYEEFFLSSHTVGDVATLVDVPANVGLEQLAPGEVPPADAIGIKASMALYPAEPSNIHHSYLGDAVKIHNISVGYGSVFHHARNGCSMPTLTLRLYGRPGCRLTRTIPGDRQRQFRVTVRWSVMPSITTTSALCPGHVGHVLEFMMFEEGAAGSVATGVKGFHTEPFALRSGCAVSAGRCWMVKSLLVRLSRP